MKALCSKKTVIITFVALIAVALWIVRFTYINTKWPNAEIVKIVQGQKVVMGDISMRIKETIIDSEENTLKAFSVNSTDKYQSFVRPFVEKGWGAKILTTTIELENLSENVVTADLSRLTAEQSYWGNGLDSFMLASINKDAQEILSIPPNSIVTVHLSFDLFDKHFPNGRFEKLDTLEFSIPLTLYPQKIVLVL
ncbi:MAG: hypothetical protein RR063_10495 [Anaerovoracaceae bacterium]